MDIKKIVIIAAVLLLALIGYNYYSSIQSKESRAEKQAEIESLRANLPQTIAETKKSEPVVDVGVESKESDEVKAEKDKDRVCDSISSVAEGAMKLRVRGIPIKTALDVVEKEDIKGEYAEQIRKMYKDIVIDAYRENDYATQEYKDKSVREFALRKYLECLDSF